MNVCKTSIHGRINSSPLEDGCDSVIPWGTAVGCCVRLGGAAADTGCSRLINSRLRGSISSAEEEVVRDGGLTPAARDL